jgi:hypothetical protein
MDKNTERWTETQRDEQKHRQMDRNTERWTETQIDGEEQIKETERQSQIDTETQQERETERQIDREAERQRGRNLFKLYFKDYNSNHCVFLNVLLISKSSLKKV